jgi:hypothetical protein
MNERHFGVRDTIKNYLYFSIDVIIYTTKEFEEVKLMCMNIGKEAVNTRRLMYARV